MIYLVNRVPDWLLLVVTSVLIAALGVLLIMAFSHLGDR